MCSASCVETERKTKRGGENKDMKVRELGKGTMGWCLSEL